MGHVYLVEMLIHFMRGVGVLIRGNIDILRADISQGEINLLTIDANKMIMDGNQELLSSRNSPNQPTLIHLRYLHCIVALGDKTERNLNKSS